MKVSLISCIIISLFLLSGCKSKSPSEPDKPTVTQTVDLMPLKVGNQWTYKWYVLNSETGEIKREYSGSDQRQLIPEYLKGNFKGNLYDGYSWDTQIIGEEHEPRVKWLYMNKPDGLYQIGGLAKTDTSINNILHYKYPVKKGESWLVPHLVFIPNEYDKFFINDSIRYECTDTNAVFQTPLGDFKCYVYRHVEDLGEDIINDWEHFEYFKPGFGLVGVIIKNYYPNNYGRSTYVFKMILQSTNLQTDSYISK